MNTKPITTVPPPSKAAAAAKAVGIGAGVGVVAFCLALVAFQQFWLKPGTVVPYGSAPGASIDSDTLAKILAAVSSLLVTLATVGYKSLPVVWQGFAKMLAAALIQAAVEMENEPDPIVPAPTPTDVRLTAIEKTLAELAAAIAALKPQTGVP